MTEVYLSIGSNMGNRLANLQKAIQMLNVPPKIDITAISSVYETEPVGGVKQDSFYRSYIDAGSFIGDHGQLTLILLILVINILKPQR